MSSEREDVVTVLVPSRDDGARLLATVTSVLAQSAPVQVLIVDDGSNDDSPADVVELYDWRVRVVCQPRRGLARTLNLALALAETRWVSVVLPGDIVAPDWCARVLEAARRDAEIGVVFVRGTPPSCAAGGAARDLASRGGGDGGTAAAARDQDEGLLLALAERNVHPRSGVLFDRACALAAGAFDPTLSSALDDDLWLRLLPRCRAIALDDALVTLDDEWRDAPDPAVVAAERCHAIAKAVASLGAADWQPALGSLASRQDEGRTWLAVARRVLRSGARPLLGHAAMLAARAVAAGVPLPDDDDFALLRGLHGGLFESADDADAAGGHVTVGGASTGTDAAAVLRVALEVASLDRGGLESVVARLALGLRTRGVQPLVICTEAGGAAADDLRRAGIEVVVLAGHDREREIAALLLERRIHVLNAHFSQHGIEIAARLGVPVVVTLHNAYAWLASGPLDDIRRVDAAVTRYVAVSESVADFTVRRFAIDPRRVTVIRNGTDVVLDAAAPDRLQARRELGIADDATVLVQVGRVDPIKSQLALVRALATLAPERPGLVAWLVGGVGSPSYAVRVQRAVVEAGLESRVVLAGERGDVPRILAAADVFVMPSVLEGLSLAALEAMAAGLPVVMTRTGDAAWLLGEQSATDGADLPGVLLDGPAFSTHVDGETLNRIAQADPPEHAERLAEALARVVADLPRFRASARARAAALAPELAVDRQLDAHARLFEEIAAADGVRGAARLAREVASEQATLDAEARALEPSASALWLLSRVLVENLATRRAAVGIARSRADLASAEIDLAVALRATTGALDKLRLTHRLRGAVRDLVRKLPGARA